MRWALLWSTSYPDLRALDDVGLFAGSKVLDDLGQGMQSDTGWNGAASLGQQRPHLTDDARDGGAVHTEPARQKITSGAMPQIHQRRQQLVDEDELVLRSGANRPPSLASGESGLMLRVPQRRMAPVAHLPARSLDSMASQRPIAWMALGHARTARQQG